jgi:small subunit ribosomal protein S11
MSDEVKKNQEEIIPETAGVVDNEEKKESAAAVAENLPVEEMKLVETENNEADNSNKEKTVVVKGKKKKKKEPFLRGGRGQVHIKSSYNNTIISVTDLNGALLVWASAGKCGFKGPKKATPYAAGVIIKSLIDKIKALGIKEAEVFVKGLGMGREAAVRALGTNGVQVISIKDVTPVAHGGVRPKKARRV